MLWLIVVSIDVLLYCVRMMRMMRKEIEQWIRTGRNGSRYSQKTNAAVDGKRFVGNLLLYFEDEIEVVEGMDGKIGGRRESYI
jgi:hypothetical protein